MKKITYVAVLSCLLALGGCNEEKGTDIQLPSGEKLTLEGNMTKNVTKPIENGTFKTFEIQYNLAQAETKAKVDERFRALGYVAAEQPNAESAAVKVHYMKKNSPTIGVLINDKNPALVSIYWQEKQQ
ncbi:hypothetical protein OGV25_05990 [Pseudomonas sp. P1B16]|jgi:hypothetical protein|uniref:hypothetical protein n=1 Tax=unclassified Pseudomonas TaxID=196821 RepID=UPI000F992B01|nr:MULTISPECIES: hypothetical protein [unclassified Pseudomonas]MBC3482388.1 hypothetical protein [Pseudomonas sp. SWRI77]MDD1960965.1 hypothetical protein [Pseudomonas sp. 39004]MDD2062646.1 hypothetical protein [Pseudomonas sp. 25571]UDU82622.1 hypothetical protein LJX93_06575 [Pseudomonas sp. HN2-3]UPL04694.1 hypothetical protein PisoF_00326 [Pseudomonas sp. IsoF]